MTFRRLCLYQTLRAFLTRWWALRAQVRNYRVVLDVQPGEVLLSLLPPWHMYERSAEYFCLASGARQVYSSVKTFKVRHAAASQAWQEWMLLPVLLPCGSPECPALAAGLSGACVGVGAG